ncbi:hypothetical protein MASR2M78_16290 [Treponema sp.]
MKRIFLMLCLCIPLMVSALELQEGRIKVVLHEETGRFSLYYLSDIQKDRYEALFVDQDPRTSFLSLLVDDRAFRLGDTTAFRFKATTENQKAAFVFESSTLSVRQEFSFIKSAGASLANGIRMDISVVNLGERDIPVGIRVLLDTKLGEKEKNHFSTDQNEINAEAIIGKKSLDRWWYSRNARIGLMGSIKADESTDPDTVHFANWKRLNDAAWKSDENKGRNFNLLPYSIGDSAVSYYFDVKPLARGAERRVSILLASAENEGFEKHAEAIENDLSRLMRESLDAAEAPELKLRTDLLTIRDLIARIDAAYESGTVSDEELAAMELVLERLSSRYGLK